MKHVVIYSDGACRGNPGPGGWGVFLRSGEHQRDLYGGERDTTNNRMELMGAIRGLEALKQPCSVALYTDSTYVMKGISEWMNGWERRGWKTASGGAVKNKELWLRLKQAQEPHQVQWHWVKGHAGDPGNEAADRLANLGIDELLSGAF